MTSQLSRDEFIATLEAKAVDNPVGAVHGAAILLLHTVRGIHWAANTWQTNKQAEATLRYFLPKLQADIERLDSLLSEDMELEASQLHNQQPLVCGREARTYLGGILELGFGLRTICQAHQCYAANEVNHRAKRKPKNQHIIKLDEDIKPEIILKYADEFVKSLVFRRLDTADFLTVETRLQSEVDKLGVCKALVADALRATYIGNRKYRIGDGAPIVLQESEDHVLRSLVKLEAASKDELERQTGKSDGPRILKAIREKHPELAPFIIMPGGKGKGGYRTKITLAEDE